MTNFFLKHWINNQWWSIMCWEPCRLGALLVENEFCCIVQWDILTWLPSMKLVRSTMVGVRNCHTSSQKSPLVWLIGDWAAMKAFGTEYPFAENEICIQYQPLNTSCTWVREHSTVNKLQNNMVPFCQMAAHCTLKTICHTRHTPPHWPDSVTYCDKQITPSSWLTLFLPQLKGVKVYDSQWIW